MGHAVIRDEGARNIAVVSSLFALLRGVRLDFARLIYRADRKDIAHCGDRSGVHHVGLEAGLCAVRHHLFAGDGLPYAVQRAHRADLIHAQAQELPFVVARHAQRDVGDLPYIRHRNDELDGRPLGHAVLIGEIHHVAGPFAVEGPHVFPHREFGAGEVLSVHVLVFEPHIDIAGRTRRQYVVRGQRNEVAIRIVDGVQRRGAGPGIRSQRKVSGALRRDGDAVHRRRHAVLDRIARAGLDIIFQVRAVFRLADDLHGIIGVSGKAQIADGIRLGIFCPHLTDSAVRSTAGRRQPAGCGGFRFTRNDVYGIHAFVHRKHRSDAHRIALLGETVQRHIARRHHDLSQGIGDQGERRLSLTVIDIGITDPQGSHFAKVQIGDLGARSQRKQTGQGIEPCQTGIRQIQPEQDALRSLARDFFAHVGRQMILLRKRILFAVSDENDACTAVLSHGSNVERTAGIVPAEIAAALRHAALGDHRSVKIDITVLGIPAVHIQTVQRLHGVHPDALAGPVASFVRSLAEDLDPVDALDGFRC